MPTHQTIIVVIIVVDVRPVTNWRQIWRPSTNFAEW